MQNSISDLIKGYVAGLTSRVLSPYFARVTQGGGIYEAPQCVESALNSQSVLNNASFILIPSGYKGGTLYSELPTNGNGDLTWTRGSDAFRTNASGLLQRVPWNLAQFSEDFSNAIWVKSRTTITSNATNAPNGTLTADKFIATSASGVHTISQSGFASEAYSFSVYAKAGEETVISLWLRSAAVGATFDLSAGTVSNITVTSATITDVGDGWYRCFVYDSTPGTTANIYGRNGSSYVGNGVDGFFIWGAQLVQGTTAQTYLPTTDRLGFPRLDYTYGSCPSALLEPQRTNLALYSEQFNIIGTWTNTIGGTGVTPTVTTNSTTSPDGTQNAETIVFNRGAGNTISDLTAIQQSVTIPTTGAYILSVYAKASTSGDIGKQVFIRLGGAGVLLPITLTQNWVRYSRAETSVASGSQIIQIGNRGTITADNTVSVDLFGAQVEAGAYPTTYIPTTSATATRVADSFSRNNIYTNGLITSSGGTWFVELRNNIVYTGGITQGQLLGLGNDVVGSNANNFWLACSDATRLRIWKQVAGTMTALYLTTTDTTKIAIKWNGSTADIFVNGTKVVSATAFTTTALESLRTVAVQHPYFIQQMDLFPTPLTDAECQALTTI